MIVSSDRALANKALKAVLAVHPLMAAEEGYTVGPGGLIAHRSPLGLAIQFGDVEMVETILATGAVDPNAPSDSTFPFGLLLSGTPLREAVVKGSIPVVR